MTQQSNKKMWRAWLLFVFISCHENKKYKYECQFDDGAYRATLNYYNPRSDFYATYTVHIEVENCVVIKIKWPNGGWLDESHIYPSALDENNRAILRGEKDKVYEVIIERNESEYAVSE